MNNLQKTRPYIFPVSPVVGVSSRDGVYIPKGYFFHLREIRVICSPADLSDVTIRVNAISKSLLSMSVPVPAINLSMQSVGGHQITSICEIDMMFTDADVVMVDIEKNIAGLKMCLVGYLIPADCEMGKL